MLTMGGHLGIDILLAAMAVEQIGGEDEDARRKTQALTRAPYISKAPPCQQLAVRTGLQQET